MDALYIEMCTPLTIVGGIMPWIVEDGDRFYNITTKQIYFYSDMLASYFETVIATPENDVWLPYQHQLQAMLQIKVWAGNPIYLIQEFSEYANHHFSDLHTMEQLWLAFIMYEKHNKTWNSGKWIDKRRQIWILP